jgi:Protein of unknown function (DUF3489)
VPAAVIAMLQRPEGATVEEVASAMGWQRHTVRGLFSGTLKKKLGLALASAKEEGSRRSAGRPCSWPANLRLSMIFLAPGVIRFAHSVLEGSGFEPSVPRAPCAAPGRTRQCYFEHAISSEAFREEVSMMRLVMGPRSSRRPWRCRVARFTPIG